MKRFSTLLQCSRSAGGVAEIGSEMYFHAKISYLTRLRGLRVKRVPWVMEIPGLNPTINGGYFFFLVNFSAIQFPWSLGCGTERERAL